MSFPPPIAIPASVSPFISVLLEKASVNPCAGTFRPIFKVLAGSGTHLLDALSGKLITDTVETFKKMIHSIRGKDDTAELFCLAVLALISMQLLATQPSTPPGYVLPSATRVSPNDKHRGSRLFAQSYFTSKRAYQTLNVVVLKAAIVCSASCSLPASHIVEKLHLSRLVIQAVDIADRSAWLEKERQKSQKLIEKVLLLCGSQLEVRDAVRSIMDPESPY